MRKNIILFVGLYVFMGCGSKKTITKPRNTKVPVSVSKKDSRVIKSEDKIVEVKPQIPNDIAVPKSSKKHTNATTAYIERYAAIAIKEMRDYKIPASITLAQGILESGNGKSPLALRSNNHFGIKCHKGWKGKSVTHDDDKLGECFRKYKYPESSYEDHSKFLTSRSRYASLFKLKTTDYHGWAYGLKRAGYATDPKYPKKLIGIIEKYKLYDYDRKFGGVVQNNYPQTQHKKDANKYYEVKKGDTLYSIAKKNQLSVDKLKKMNGLTDNVIQLHQKLKIK